MSIQDSLNAAREKLEALMKDRRFRKANLSREEQIELQTAQAMCAGKLSRCQKDFNRIIEDQSRNILEGERLGINTEIQEDMLRNAAIGYLLVRDAIFALQTINNHTSISHAYEMMDLASRHMSGKRSGLPLKAVVSKSGYQSLTSNAAYNEKLEIVNGFFDDLVEYGDIEGCLNNTLPTGNQDPARDNAQPAPVGDSDSSKARLQGMISREHDETDYTSRGNARGKGNTYVR